MAAYVSCRLIDIADGVRFDTPAPCQGQTVQVRYGGFDTAEHDDGDPYKSVIDHSTGEVDYYVRRDLATSTIADGDRRLRSLRDQARKLAETWQMAGAAISVRPAAAWGRVVITLDGVSVQYDPDAIVVRSDMSDDVRTTWRAILCRARQVLSIRAQIEAAT